MESRAGCGTTFGLEIPFDKQTHPAERPGQARLPADLQGKRVLLVDDNETHRHGLTVYLKSWGARHATAASGPEALTLLHRGFQDNDPFDLLLSDMVMPDMDGLALGRAVKADPKFEDLRMILLTSGGLRGDAALARKAGFDVYVTKPIQQSQLFDALLYAFGNREDQREGKTRIGTVHAMAEAAKQRTRILLVEDNVVNQKVALMTLAKFGYQADVANNGRQALERLAKKPYDIVLMDVQMPVMDGLAAAREIRKADRPLCLVPVIALTAGAFSEDRQRCEAAGMNDFLTKPFDPQKMYDIIRKWTAAGNT